MTGGLLIWLVAVSVVGPTISSKAGDEKFSIVLVKLKAVVARSVDVSAKTIGENDSVAATIEVARDILRLLSYDGTNDVTNKDHAVFISRKGIKNVSLSLVESKGSRREFLKSKNRGRGGRCNGSSFA